MLLLLLLWRFVAILRVLGKGVVVVGEGELLPPAPHTFGTRDGSVSFDADLENL